MYLNYPLIRFKKVNYVKLLVFYFIFQVTQVLSHVNIAYKKKLKLYGPFLWIGFNFLEAAEPLRGDSL